MNDYLDTANDTIDDFLDTLVEVKIFHEEDFLKIRETLSRIGVASKKDNTLYQSCHILHKQGRYYIVHFKEMFMLDGKEADFTDEDLSRRNRIAYLLDEWGLVEVLEKETVDLEPIAAMNQIKVINYKEKNNWKLETKYNIGRKRS